MLSIVFKKMRFHFQDNDDKSNFIIRKLFFVNPNSDLYSIKKSTPLFNEYIFIYFKNLNDQIIQLQDRIETYCDLLSSLTSFYILINNEEMNRIMRFLTLVSVTFIPMMFLIGLFSMNYQNTPTLLWYHGYFTILAVLGIFAISMICLFKWKNLL
jgi:magnesium transporter